MTRMELNLDERALARAVDCITAVNRARVKKAQGGHPDSAYVGVPWRRFLELVAAIDEARPGWIDRTYDLMAERAREKKGGTA